MDASKDLYSSFTSSNSTSTFKTFSPLFSNSFNICCLSYSKTAFYSSNLSFTIFAVISSMLGLPFSICSFNSYFNP